jgi:hypothetical protein
METLIVCLTLVVLVGLLQGRVVLAENPKLGRIILGKVPPSRRRNRTAPKFKASRKKGGR